MMDDLREKAYVETKYTPEQIEKDIKRSAIFTSVAVFLYIICIVPLLIFKNEIGLIFLFVFVGVATALIIYNNMTRLKCHRSYNYNNDIEAKDSENYRGFKSITSAIWSLALIVYFIVSFTTMAWHITWVIFLIATTINSIIKAIYDFRRG